MQQADEDSAQLRSGRAANSAVGAQKRRAGQQREKRIQRVLSHQNGSDSRACSQFEGKCLFNRLTYASMKNYVYI